MATEEMIDVIDDSGKIIGNASKTEIYEKKLPHGIVHVLIYDQNNLMACQIRSQKKDYRPGYISTSVGGHISSGETPVEAGLREMAEEIGKDGDLQHLFSQWYESEKGHRKILHVYRSDALPPFRLNPDEVEAIEWLSHDELKQLGDNKIHPELKFIIKYLENEEN
jgi:isopentenyldiphosphate isomerase